MSAAEQSLEGRVAIVTGASRGVGRACALALARAGCKVVLAAKTVKPRARLPGTIHTVAEEIGAAVPGAETLAVRCDVREEQEIVAMIDAALERFGRLDILVNNAGAAWWFPVESTPARRFDLVMDVNFRAAHVATAHALPHLRKNGWGHVVNMSPPVHKAEVVGGKCAYMVSKFGMTYLGIALKEELGDQPIAVNALWPVTLVESLATANLGLGEPKDWRKADILADALLAILRQDPTTLGSGHAFLDEEVLREYAGVTDLEGYACVPGSTPMVIPW
ncbi:MAG: SDR family oxidoreductase [Deltaproteobacteria bacterium]|nr:SDR family oxidoreductase [Deltaproteobacteria bacterium]